MEHINSNVTVGEYAQEDSQLLCQWLHWLAKSDDSLTTLNG
jgi:hypothetical protein